MMKYLIYILIVVLAQAAEAETYVIANRQGVDGNQAFVAEKMVQSNYNDCVLWMPAPSATAWTNDFSSEHNDATAYGDAAWSSTNSGCMSFDGAGDYVSVADSTSLRPANMTYAIWIKTSDTATQVVFDKYSGSGGGNDSYYRGCGIAVVSSNAVWAVREVPNAATSISGTSNVTDGDWHYIVGTYDGSNSFVFVDGRQENSIATSNYDPSTEPLCIGQRFDSGLWFDGDTAGAVVWDIALTATQITNIYDATKGKHQ